MNLISDINTPIQLNNLFDQLSTEKDGQRGVLVEDRTGYQVVHLDKHRHRFVPFSELVDMVDRLKTGLATNPANAQKLSEQLKIMTEHKLKREANQNIVIRFIFQVIERIKNLFKSRGFLTSAGYANKLIEHFESLTDLPHIPEEDLIPDHREEKERPRLPVRRALLRRQSTRGKLSALNTFRANPVECPQFQKSIIFRDIGTYEDLCSLILEISESSHIDFNDPWSRVVTLEALKFVTKETSDQILEKLTVSEEFNHLLFLEILNLLVQKASDHIAFSLYSLEQLMKTYMNKDWYHDALPLDDETLIKGMQLLVKSNPNMEPTTRFIKWLIKENKLTFSSCVACITAYLQKKWEKPAEQQINLHCPNLDLLNTYFKDQGWQDRAGTVQNLNVRRHLQGL